MTAQDRHWADGPGITSQDCELLGLLEDVGIDVDTCDVGMDDHFLDLARVGRYRPIYDRPEYRDALIVWFMTGEDQMAAEKVTYDGPFEFGCEWLRVRPPLTLRALVNHLRGRVTGYYATAIPRRDVPEMIRLLRQRKESA